MESAFSLSPLIVVASFLAAAVPTVVLVAFVYWLDRYEKEPGWLLASAFFWGAIPSIVTAFMLNTLLSLLSYLIFGPVVADVIGAVFVAPTVEELLKGAAVVGILIFWRNELDSPLDGIIYGATVGLGFAMIENIFYFLIVYSEGGSGAWTTNVFLRGYVFGLNHALFTSMTGLGVALARLSSNRPAKIIMPLGGLLFAVLFHFIHNITALVGGIALTFTILNAWGGLTLLAILVVWSLLQERRWLRLYLAEEVEMGTLTDSQYKIVCSSYSRVRHRCTLFRSDGYFQYRLATRFFHRCSELAYKKHHYARLKESATIDLTSKLREEISALGRQLSSAFPS